MALIWLRFTLLSKLGTNFIILVMNMGQKMTLTQTHGMRIKEGYSFGSSYAIPISWIKREAKL